MCCLLMKKMFILEKYKIKITIGKKVDIALIVGDHDQKKLNSRISS